jgi:CheY-like chemotaxis protein
MSMPATLCETSPHDDARIDLYRNRPVTEFAPAAMRRLRVLIADDYEDTCETMALLLRLWGHEVQVATDGAAALDAACAWRPDVVLADIGMPRLNGYDLARQLRLQAGLEQILLIAVSGYADQAHRTLGLQAGYDVYLAKPAAAGRLQQLLFVEQSRLRILEPTGSGPLLLAQGGSISAGAVHRASRTLAASP